MTTRDRRKENRILVLAQPGSEVISNLGGHQADIVSSPDDASDRYGQHKYHMLIVDMAPAQLSQTMPFLESIRNKSASQEILLVMDKEQQQNLEGIVDGHCTMDYVLNPLDPAYLSHRIERALLIGRKNYALEKKDKEWQRLSDLGQYIGNLISSSGGLDEKLSELAARTKEAIGARDCSLYICKDGRSLEPIYSDRMQESVEVPLDSKENQGLTMRKAIGLGKPLILSHDDFSKAGGCASQRYDDIETPDNAVIIPIYEPQNKQLLGVLNLASIPGLRADDLNRSKYQVMQGLLSSTINNMMQYRRIEELSLQDPKLTILYNSGYFMELLRREIQRSDRIGSNLSLIMGDIDHFKDVNDTYGHLTGDHVLIRTAQIYVDTIRGGTDFAGRYGGEEFVIGLGNTDIYQAIILAQRLRNQIQDQSIDPDSLPAGLRDEVKAIIRKDSKLGPNIKYTSSFGVAQYQPGWSAEQLISAADTNLYIAKRSGRNRVFGLPQE